MTPQAFPQLSTHSALKKAFLIVVRRMGTDAAQRELDRIAADALKRALGAK